MRLIAMSDTFKVPLNWRDLKNNAEGKKLESELKIVMDEKELLIIADIVKRASEMAQAALQPEHYAAIKPYDWYMAIALCHYRFRRLKLLQLLMASPNDFANDVFGITAHFDRVLFTMPNGWKFVFEESTQ